MTTSETNEAAGPMRVPMSVVKAAHKDGRVEGIVVGLEMALNFIGRCKDKGEAEMMVRAALASAKMPDANY